MSSVDTIHKTSILHGFHYNSTLCDVVTSICFRKLAMDRNTWACVINRTRRERDSIGKMLCHMHWISPLGVWRQGKMVLQWMLSTCSSNVNGYCKIATHKYKTINNKSKQMHLIW